MNCHARRMTDGADNAVDGLSDLEAAVVAAADEWSDGCVAAAHLSIARFVEAFLEIDGRAVDSAASVMKAIARLDQVGLFALTDWTRANGLGDTMAGFRVSSVGRLTARQFRERTPVAAARATSVQIDLGEQFEGGMLEQPRCWSDGEKLRALARRSGSVVPILLLLLLEPRWIRRNLGAALGRLERRMILRGSRKRPGLSDRWLREIVGQMVECVPGLRCYLLRNRAIVELTAGEVSFQFVSGEKPVAEEVVVRVLRESFGLGKVNALAKVSTKRGRLQRGYDPSMQSAPERDELDAES